MKQEQMQNELERVSEEIRLAVNECFVGVTKKTEDGFILDLGRAGAYHIIVTRV